MTMMVPVALAVAFLCALGMTWWLARPGAWLAPLDIPNERSLHATPKPRGGGLGVLAGFGVGMVMGFALLPDHTALPALVVSMALVAGVSYADDRMHVGIFVRLGVQGLAAALAVGWGGLAPSVLTFPGVAVGIGAVPGFLLAVLAVVWLTNLYNFMDGLDGLAGTMSCIGLGTLAWLASSQAPGLALLAGLLAAGAAGFLVWNAPPARIFMGDVGASTLGFAAAIIILWGDASAVFPWWLGVVVFGVFIADATVTLIRRGLNRERIWEAHRTHFYQRLVTLGWSHRRALVLNATLMLACSVAALVAQSVASVWQWLIVLIVALLLGGTMVWVTFLERTRAS
jgi:UDP-N-acetylmuramyl pentapeptide phosphotransferase/UDP-N-acetylglucosamine-1-phosphate transferase